MKSWLHSIFGCVFALCIMSFLTFYYVDHDLQQLHTDLVNINASIQLIGK